MITCSKIMNIFTYRFCFLQVDTILRTNEYTHDFHEGSVKSYDSNQLASNNPIEDTRSEASCLFTTGKSFKSIFPNRHS